MSGVRHGAYLEQLERLLAHVEQEIAQERQRMLLDGATWTTFERTPRSTGGDVNPGRKRCDELGVTPKQVKEWAVRAGLLEKVVQGRVARWMVDAYAEAHGQ